MRPIKRFTPKADHHLEWLDFTVHRDHRGSVAEVFRASQGHTTVEQLNLSVSQAGVLRGLHWHQFQTDYWIIASGMAQVAVSDLVESGKSLTFESRVLAPGQGVKIPPKQAHGFLALSDLVLLYAVDKEYNHDSPDEWTVAANEFDGWMRPLDKVILSERDRAALFGYQRIIDATIVLK